MIASVEDMEKTINRIIQNQDQKTRNVLFVCANNARLSLIAESLLRSYRVRGVRAFSAGIDPADRADSFALSALTLAGLGNEGLWPKHWEWFANQRKPLIDVVVMIGAETADCLPRNFPGNPEYLTWNIDGETALRFHHGVWRDMQMLRPYVEELADGLHNAESMPVETIRAEAAE
jgi:arsenate reductase